MLFRSQRVASEEEPGENGEGDEREGGFTPTPSNLYSHTNNSDNTPNTLYNNGHVFS